MTSSSIYHCSHEDKSPSLVEGKPIPTPEEEQHLRKVEALQTWLLQQPQTTQTSIATIVQPEYWPPRNNQMKTYYDWSLPTHVVYSDPTFVSATPLSTRPTKNHHDENEEDKKEEEERRRGEMGNNHEVETAAIVENMCRTNYQNDTKHNDNEVKEGDEDRFAPTFCEARSKLDYSYHTHVVKPRQYLQDAIIQRIVSTSNLNNYNNTATTSMNNSCVPTNEPHSSSTTHRPWIVFTAGPMGVGKGYVITQLQQLQLLNVKDHFITIDPDLIKYEIPEMVGYLQVDRQTAATKVHRESTQISDIIFEYSILRSLSILVDGSLRDVDYYQSLFHRIRTEYPHYRIGIIHITASREVILERAATRAVATGRVIPKELLEESMEQVPKSVELLSPLADAVHVIANHPHQPIQLVSSTIRRRNSDGEDVLITTTSWKEFAESWDLPPPVATTIRTPAGDTVTLHTANDTKLEEELKVPKEEATNVASSSSNIGDRPEVLGNTKTTNIVPSNDSRSKVLQNSISMSQFFDDHPTHVVANAIWQKCYPNFCARCALVSDEQCGICIHNVHICACSICSEHPTCKSGTSNTV